MIVCPECGGKISDQAKICIHYGYPLLKKVDVKEEGVISICKYCNEKIFLQDDVCHFCGSKIEKDWYKEENLCKINGKEYNLTPYIIGLSQKNLTWQESAQISKSLQVLTGCADCSKICLNIEKGEMPPRVFNGMTIDEVAKQVSEWKKSRENRIHCPYCGSTYVEKRQFLPHPCATFQKYWYCKSCHSRFDVIE